MSTIKGFLVVVVEDGCAATSPDNHQKGLHGMKGFCRIIGLYFYS